MIRKRCERSGVSEAIEVGHCAAVKVGALRRVNMAGFWAEGWGRVLGVEVVASLV